MKIGEEECDDANEVDDDACRTTCRVARCGDGVIRTDISEGAPGYESCDDGNRDDGDLCLTNCTHGSDREAARQSMLAALGAARIKGIKTNRNFLMNCLESAPFRQGDVYTGLVDENLKALTAERAIEG